MQDPCVLKTFHKAVLSVSVQQVETKLLSNFLINKNDHVEFQVFTVVTMKNANFWDMEPCGSYKN
jgi:hypothetical protein